MDYKKPTPSMFQRGIFKSDSGIKWDYMGSAQFEGGTLENHLTLLGYFNNLHIRYFGSAQNDAGQLVPLWYVGPQENSFMNTAYQVFFVEELTETDELPRRRKEPLYFKEAIQENSPIGINIWFCVSTLWGQDIKFEQLVASESTQPFAVTLSEAAAKAFLDLVILHKGTRNEGQ